MHFPLKLALLGSILTVRAFAAGDPPLEPWANSALHIESGVLFEVGDNTPFDYELVPVQFSWRSAEFLGHGFSDGSRIVVRHRLTGFVTLVRNGPESLYVGVSASPSIEWWDKTGRWALFGGAGGGFGLIDSREIEGGQGQDFTLHWFIRGGIEHVMPGSARLTLGVMFQHMSNGGATDPNPGINALGLMLGYSWTY
jgi:hypothetical protein